MLLGRDWKELARKESPETALHLAVVKDGVAGTNVPASSGVLRAAFLLLCCRLQGPLLSSQPLTLPTLPQCWECQLGAVLHVD